MKKIFLLSFLILSVLNVLAQTGIKEEDIIIGDDEGVQPEFPGGMQELMNFVTTHTCYPAYELYIGIQGKVFVAFVVDTSGKAIEPNIKRGLSSGLDSVAIKMIEQMPLWKPGTYNGKKVSVKYVLPVRFKIVGAGQDRILIPAACNEPKKKK